MVCRYTLLTNEQAASPCQVFFTVNPNIEVLLCLATAQPNEQMLKNNSALSRRIQKRSQENLRYAAFVPIRAEEYDRRACHFQRPPPQVSKPKSYAGNEQSKKRNSNCKILHTVFPRGDSPRCSAKPAEAMEKAAPEGTAGAVDFHPEVSRLGA